MLALSLVQLEPVTDPTQTSSVLDLKRRTLLMDTPINSCL